MESFASTHREEILRRELSMAESLIRTGHIFITVQYTSDNGKVLMVVSGAWAAAELPVYNGGVS